MSAMTPIEAPAPAGHVRFAFKLNHDCDDVTSFMRNQRNLRNIMVDSDARSVKGMSLPESERGRDSDPAYRCVDVSEASRAVFVEKLISSKLADSASIFQVTFNDRVPYVITT